MPPPPGLGALCKGSVVVAVCYIIWDLGLGSGSGIWVWDLGLGSGSGIWIWVWDLGSGIWVWDLDLGSGIWIWIWDLAYLLRIFAPADARARFLVNVRSSGREKVEF